MCRPRSRQGYCRAKFLGPRGSITIGKIRFFRGFQISRRSPRTVISSRDRGTGRRLQAAIFVGSKLKGQEKEQILSGKWMNWHVTFGQNRAVRPQRPNTGGTQAINIFSAISRNFE